MNNCIFCKIITREIPATIVYEDNNNIAFLDINAVNPGHVLVIPKEHSTNMYDIPEESCQQLIVAVQKVMHAVKKATNCAGITLGVNNEAGAGQVVFHTHFHVMPRFPNDGHQLWEGKPYNNDAEKAAVGEKIRKAF